MLTLAAAVELQLPKTHQREFQHARVASRQPMPMMVCLGGAQKAFQLLVQWYLPLQQSGVAELQLQHMMGLGLMKILTMPCLGDAQMHVRDRWEQASR